jgi:DNA-binding transcriptional LysR family regulator
VTITAEGKLFLEDAREVLKRADESVEKENPRFLIRVNDVSTFASQPRCPVNYNAEQPCTIEGLLLSPGRLRFDCGCEVRIHAQLREHDAEKGVAVELLDLAVFHTYQKSAPGSRAWLRSAG